MTRIMSLFEGLTPKQAQEFTRLLVPTLAALRERVIKLNPPKTSAEREQNAKEAEKLDTRHINA